VPGEGGDVLHFTGQKADGSHFAVMDIFFGGWGGRPMRDGIDGVAPMAFGSYGTIPAELLEREFPLVVDGFGYVPDTAGAGKYRGSLSIYKQWRFLQPGKVMVRTNRLLRASDGMNGGAPGSLSTNILNPEEDNLQLPRKAHMHLDVRPVTAFTMWFPAPAATVTLGSASRKKSLLMSKMINSRLLPRGSNMVW
jgi:N-methylhydantoinase B